MKKKAPDWKFIHFLFLLLALAPFYPEPHLVGKILWILGGANGMGALDWFDFLYHGIPAVLFIRIVILKALAKYAEYSENQQGKLKV